MGNYESLMEKGADFYKFIEEFALEKQGDEQCCSSSSGIKTELCWLFFLLSKPMVSKVCPVVCIEIGFL